MGECHNVIYCKFLVNKSTQVSMLCVLVHLQFSHLLFSFQDHQNVACLSKTCTSHSPPFCSHHTCTAVDLSSDHEQELLEDDITPVYVTYILQYTAKYLTYLWVAQPLHWFADHEDIHSLCLGHSLPISEKPRMLLQLYIQFPSLVPRPRSAFHRFQYGKAGEGLE